MRIFKRVLFVIMLSIAFANQAMAVYPTVKGGAGGIPLWQPAVNYKIDEHVNESDKIYRALIDHLSTPSFASDLGAGSWTEVSDDLNRLPPTVGITGTMLRFASDTGDDIESVPIFVDLVGNMTNIASAEVGDLSLSGNLIDVLTSGNDLTLRATGPGQIILDDNVLIQGTQTAVNSTILDVEDANITVNKGGLQAVANANVAGITVESTDAPDARIGYASSTAGKFIMGEVGSEDPIVGETLTQQLTNKELGNTAVIDANLVIDMISTTKASRPCPQMTEAERDLLTAVDGSCVFNTDQSKLNIYDGSDWVAAGGGLDPWQPAFNYRVDDVVHESDKIYLSQIDATSTPSFASDLGAGWWTELSDDLNRLGSSTDNALVVWGSNTGDIVRDSSVLLSLTNDMTNLNTVQAGSVTMGGSGLTSSAGPIFFTPTSGVTIATGDLQVSNLVQDQVIFGGTNNGQLTQDANFLWNDLTDTLAINGAATVVGSATVTGQLYADNLLLDGDTISNVNPNSSIVLSPTGTGSLESMAAFLFNDLPFVSTPTGNQLLVSNVGGDLYKKDSNGVELKVDKDDVTDYVLNRSFEKSYAASPALSWTLAAGTASVETVDKIAPEGSKSLSVALTAQALDLSQSLDLSSLDNAAVGASAWIKTDNPNVQLCFRTDCRNHSGSNQWEKLSVATFATATADISIQTVGTMTGTVLVDGVRFDDSPYGEIDLLDKVQQERWDTGNGYGSSNTAIRRFTNQRDPEGSGIYNLTNTATTGLSVTMIERAYCAFGYSENESGPTTYPGLSLNSNQLSTNINTIDREDRLDLASTWADGTNASTQWSGWLDAGDVVRPHGNGSGAASDRVHFSVSCRASGAAIITPAANVPNDFSARIDNNGTATVISENSSFIASVNRTSAGFVDIVFTAGFFADIPSFVATPDYDGGPTDKVISYTGLTTSGVTVVIQGLSPAVFEDTDFSIQVSRQGIDVKDAAFLAATPKERKCILSDQKTSGTTGGGSVAAGVQARDLNTQEGSCSFLYLDSALSQFTLVKGKYCFDGESPIYFTDRSKSFLYNVTDATYDIEGSNIFANASVSFETKSTMMGCIEVTGTKVFEFRQFTQVAKASDGLGRTTNSAGNPQSFEKYSVLEITKEL